MIDRQEDQKLGKHFDLASHFNEKMSEFCIDRSMCIHVERTHPSLVKYVILKCIISIQYLEHNCEVVSNVNKDLSKININ